MNTPERIVHWDRRRMPDIPPDTLLNLHIGERTHLVRMRDTTPHDWRVADWYSVVEEGRS